MNGENINIINAKIKKIFGLSNKELYEIEKYLLEINLNPGEIVNEFDKFPKGVVFIIHGEMRLVGKAANNHILTVQKYKSNEIAGAVQTFQGNKSFQLSASTEVIGFFIEATNFLKVLNDLKKISKFYQRITKEEYYSLTDKISNPNKLNSKAILDWANNEASKNKEIVLLPKGKHQLKIKNKSWIVSSTNIKNKNIGSEIKYNEEIEVIGNMNARIIQKPEKWPNILLDQSNNDISEEEIKLNLDFKDAADTETIKSLEDFYGYKSLEFEYPDERGNGVKEEILACFRMICLFFGVKFKKELISKIINNQQKNKNNVVSEINIYQIAGILNFIGFQTSLKNPKSKDLLSRIPLPAITLLNHKPIILWKKKNDKFFIGDPVSGKRYLDLNELLIKKESIDILHVEKSKDAPKKRFGFDWFSPYIRKYKFALMQVVIASFFVQLLALFNPLLIQQIIDIVINQGSIKSLNILGILLISMALSQAILGSLRTYLFSDTTNRIDISLGKKIINHLFRLPLSYYLKTRVGEVSSRLSELEKIRNFLTGTALTILLDGIFSVIYIAVMLAYSVKLTIWTLSVIPFFIVLTVFISPIIKRQLREQAEANAKVNSHLVETISGIETIKGQGVEMQSEWRWERLYGKQINAGFKNIITSTTASSVSNFLQQISGLIVIWVGSTLVLKGQLTIGQLIAFRILSSYVTNPLLRLAGTWQNFQEITVSINRLSDIIDHPTEIEISGEDLSPMPPIKGNISFEAVNFSFKNSNQSQIKNLDIFIPKGSFVGIVGSSGSGKSTLLKLLLRFHDVKSGKILIDNFDISKVDLYSLRSQIGIVPQENLLFDGTITTNISLGKPYASYEEVISSSKLSCSHEFIEKLKNGYSTQLSEKGSELSGGQKQRLAIARMILKNPNLVILDEATSALDVDTEKRVIQNIINYFNSKTIFFISHRLNSLINADMILVMHEGRLVEKGSHLELMESNGRYATLFMQQDKGL